MGASVATAVIMMKERELVAAFRAARATAPETAETTAALGVPERIAFHRLRDRAILREAEPGHYYLDEPGWAAFRRNRRRSVIFLVLAAMIFAFWAWRKASPTP